MALVACKATGSSAEFLSSACLISMGAAICLTDWVRRFHSLVFSGWRAFLRLRALGSKSCQTCPIWFLMVCRCRLIAKKSAPGAQPASNEEQVGQCRISMCRRKHGNYRASLFLSLCLIFLLSTQLEAKTTSRVYFKGTDAELEVHFINGEVSGPTLLLLGGIQGDEPGGYLAADLYADISLKKGNMIVVPRANFPSIVGNSRGVAGDMNRKFAVG